MKIIMDVTEITELIRKSFPKEMIPENHEITEIETKGYPEKEYIIHVEKKEEIP